MKNWKHFEFLATKFLNKKYNSYNLSFKKQGGSNANAADIKVHKENKHIFNIEVKLFNSQSGQFVVRIKDNKFIFSSKNLYDKNEYTQEIIGYLNENFAKYKNVQQSSIEIDTNSKIFEEWIINHYKNKDSKFIIVLTKDFSIASESKSSIEDFISIVPINKISDCFEIEAFLRRKMSGTRHLPLKEIEKVKKILRRYLYMLNKISLNNFKTTKENKTFIVINRGLSRSERYFGEGVYYLSPDKRINNKHKYFIKKRSRTNNINVIFSLRYISPIKNSGFEEFRKFIQKY